MTELEDRVQKVREMCSRQSGEKGDLARAILLTLDGAEGVDRPNPYDHDDCCCHDGPGVPTESTLLEKVAGRTLATVGVLCLVALMIGATLALLRWWL